MQAFAVFLYQANPVAHRLIDLIVDYTVGEEITIRGRDAETQEVLERFWFDWHNDWPNRLHDLARDTAINGESLYVLDDVQPTTGLIRVRHFDPSFISAVKPDESDLSRPAYVHLKQGLFIRPPEMSDAEYNAKHVLSLIRDTGDGKHRELQGQALLLQINKVASATRGLSDLLSLLNWLDVLERFLGNVADRLAHLGMWFYDITLEGASDREIRNYREKLLREPPRPGALRVHSDRVTWKPTAVNLPGEDIASPSLLFMSHILTGAGIPVHWASQSGAAGRTVAADAQDPIFKHLSTRQGVLRRFVRRILEYQIYVAQSTGKLAKKRGEFGLFFPRIGLRDLQRAGGAAARFLEVLSHLVDSGILDVKDVQLVYEDLITQMGLSKRIDTPRWEPEEEAALSTIAENLESLYDEMYQEGEQWTSNKEARDRIQQAVKASSKLLETRLGRK